MSNKGAAGMRVSSSELRWLIDVVALVAMVVFAIFAGGWTPASIGWVSFAVVVILCYVRSRQE